MLAVDAATKADAHNDARSINEITQKVLENLEERCELSFFRYDLVHNLLVLFEQSGRCPGVS
jgi:hypothetical protein